MTRQPDSDGPAARALHALKQALDHRFTRAGLPEGRFRGGGLRLIDPARFLRGRRRLQGENEKDTHEAHFPMLPDDTEGVLRGRSRAGFSPAT